MAQAKNQRLLPWYREAELAHGRVCMLAVTWQSMKRYQTRSRQIKTAYDCSMCTGYSYICWPMFTVYRTIWAVYIGINIFFVYMIVYIQI